MSGDPYFSTETCVDRLYFEYSLHKKLIIALDFDDTIFDFHKKSRAYDNVISLIKECQELGFYIVIFTGSPLDKYNSIREYCINIGIQITSINKNAFPLPFGNDGKIYFNILLDDRSGLGQSYDILQRTLQKIKNEN